MKLSNQQKTGFIFYGILAILFFVIFLVVVLFINIYPIFDLVISNQSNMTCDCTHNVVFLLNHPYIGSLVIFVVISISLFVIYILFQILRNIITTKKYINSVLKNKIKLNVKIKDILKSIGLEKKVVLVKNDFPEVFCFGFIKPKVCISSKLVKQVSKNQLRAILLHEKNHIKSRDPLKLCVVYSMRKSLFFIPGLKELIDYFIVNLELSADERATNNFKEIKSLSNALLKLSNLHKGYKKHDSNNLLVSFLSITEARIDRLIDKSFSITLKIGFIKFLVGMFIFVGLFIIVFNSQIWLVEAGQINGMGTNLICSMEPQDQIVNNWENLSCNHESANMSCLDEVNTVMGTCS